MFAFLRNAFAKPAPPKAPARRTLAIDYYRCPDSPAPANPDPPIRPADYFDPSSQRFRSVDPTELVNAHFELVQQIFEATGMTRAEFRPRLYRIFEFAAAFYQLAPASKDHHHREPGGLFLHSMQVCLHAVHLGQFARFERDRTRPVSPTDQKDWSVALAVAALTHDAGKLLTDFRVVHPSFFTPGRLRPRLDDGPPAQDEPALFVPYNDTIYEWLERRGYSEYQIRWLDDRFARHQRHTQALLAFWTTAVNLNWLPEKIRSTLACNDPVAGSIDADFWDIIQKADHRSTNQYFPAVSGNASSIIADTLRRLVSEGRWRPSPDRFPLRIGANQRLLLLAPNDLAQLAREVTTHPLSYALSATGVFSADQLRSHLQFECLIEADRSGQVLFGPALAGAPLPANQSVLVLNESLSRELIELALLAPPAVAPALANATASAAGPQPVDLSGLADPIAVAPTPAVPPTRTQAAKPAPATSAPPQPANPATVATPALIELPPLVFKFLEYVQSLKPRDIRTADKAGQPRPGNNVTPEHIRIDLQLMSGIRLGRPLIQRFAKTHAYPLDTVFTSLIGCPQVIEHTEPLPPQPTLWLTMSLPASKAVYNQELSKFAKTAAAPVHSVARQAPPAPSAAVVQPSTAPRSQPAHSSPDFTDSLARLSALPATAELTITPLPYLVSLLLRVLAHPSVSSRLSCPSTDKTALVPFDVLGNVLEKARQDGMVEAAGLDPTVLAECFLAIGFPVELHPDGLLLTEEIEPYWATSLAGSHLP